MSKVESVNFCYICDLAFEARKQFIKHNLSDEHLNRARKEMRDETMERVYDSEEEYYFLRPKTKTKTETKIKDNTKNFIKTKPSFKPKNEPKIASTLELRLNVKNVMKNLEIK